MPDFLETYFAVEVHKSLSEYFSVVLCPHQEKNKNAQEPLAKVDV